MASALSPTMSLGRPGRCTSPAEIMVVMPPLRPESMKSIVRCRGVKSPKTGWQYESMRPGTTVLPRGSITVSASTLRTCPPDTICSMFLIRVFTHASWSSDRQILSPHRLVGHELGHGALEADLPFLDDV